MLLSDFRLRHPADEEPEARAARGQLQPQHENRARAGGERSVRLSHLRLVSALTDVSVSKVAPGVFKYVPSPVDKEVKVGVIRDTLRLMDPGHRKASM